MFRNKPLQKLEVYAIIESNNIQIVEHLCEHTVYRSCVNSCCLHSEIRK